MKAWLIDRFEGVSNLRLADVPDPTPADNEVVLDVLFAALNPADRYLAEGQYPAKPPLPHTLGRDGVGIARAVGAKVTDVKVGERYTILRGAAGVHRAGTFAEKVVVPQEVLVPVPEGWSLEEASCAALVYVTSHQALRQWEDLPKGATVLITGASGGVGVASTQLAAAMGYRVIALSRSEEKRGELQRLGASLALDPGDDTWWKQVREHLGGPKVDLAIDNIGGALFPLVVGTLGYKGRISCVGALAGPVPDFNTATLFFRRNRVGGVAIDTYTNAEARAAWDEVLGLLKRAGTKPLVDRVVAFDDLKSAFDRLKQGPMGKVVVSVGGST